MEQQMIPLIPVDQVVIPFAGHDFLVVRFSDGRIAVVLRHLCEAIDVDRRGQTRRIQLHPVLSKSLLLAQIETPGGPQVVNVLVTWAMPLWLGGFDLTRLSEERRELIMLLQTDAVDAFNSHFYQIDAQARPQQQAKTPQPPPPLPPRDEPPPSVAEVFQAMGLRIGQEMQRIEDRQTALEQDNQRLEGQLASQDRQHQKDVAWLDRQYHEVLPLLAEANHRMQLQAEQIEVLWSVVWGRASASEEALSADQLHALELLLHYHQKATGQPLRVTRREMLGLVGAADLPNLQQRDWKPILTWFRQRLGQNL